MQVRAYAAVITTAKTTANATSNLKMAFFLPAIVPSLRKLAKATVARWAARLYEFQWSIELLFGCYLEPLSLFHDCSKSPFVFQGAICNGKGVCICGVCHCTESCYTGTTCNILKPVSKLANFFPTKLRDCLWNRIAGSSTYYFFKKQRTDTRLHSDAPDRYISKK